MLLGIAALSSPSTREHAHSGLRGRIFHRGSAAAPLFISAFGAGSIAAAFGIGRMFRRAEADLRLGAPDPGPDGRGMTAFALSPAFWLAHAALFVAGAGSLATITLFTTGIQQRVRTACGARSWPSGRSAPWGCASPRGSWTGSWATRRPARGRPADAGPARPGRGPGPVAPPPFAAGPSPPAWSSRMNQPKFFATRAEWRAWLERHHAEDAELVVGFHKWAAAGQHLPTRVRRGGAVLRLDRRGAPPHRRDQLLHAVHAPPAEDATGAR